MNFQPARYLEAVMAMDFSLVECNLAFSGVDCPYSLAELGITTRVFDKGDFHGQGNPELKEEIAKRYGVEQDQVLIPGGGTSLCNFLFAAALLGEGDQAIVETPTYEPLQALVQSTGAEIVPLPRPPERNCDIDIEECLDLMKPSVKLVIITRLHNPSGRDISIDLLQQIGERAAEIGAYVLVDEVYLDFLPEGESTPAVTLHPNLLSTNSLTKVYGQGGLRTGWGIGPEDLVRKCWRINNVLGVVPPFIPDAVAFELFRNGGVERIQAWGRGRARENMTIVENWMGGQSQLSWIKPDAGIFALIRLKNHRKTDLFVQFLKEKFRTAVMPGTFFGVSDGFRLGFGCEPGKLKEGLHRIDLALSEWGT